MKGLFFYVFLEHSKDTNTFQHNLDIVSFILLKEAFSFTETCLSQTFLPSLNPLRLLHGNQQVKTCTEIEYLKE